MGCWAAALSAGVRFRGGGFAGGGQIRHSGVGLSRGWAVEHHCAMGDTPMRSEQRIRARDGVCGGGGGCARRSVAGVRSRGCWGVLQAKVASVKVRRGLAGAHRGRDTAGVAVQNHRRRGPAVARCDTRGQVAAERHRPPGSHGESRCRSANAGGGSIGPEERRR